MHGLQPLWPRAGPLPHPLMLSRVVGPQRGDAEMSQKLWRVVRSCVELGDDNPIQQIHDQGAGGNCNVVKEIIYPLGAEIDVRQVTHTEGLPCNLKALNRPPFVSSMTIREADMTQLVPAGKVYLLMMLW